MVLFEVYVGPQMTRMNADGLDVLDEGDEEEAARRRNRTYWIEEPVAKALKLVWK